MRILILNEYFCPDVASTAQHGTDLALACLSGRNAGCLDRLPAVEDIPEPHAN
jgi:hypothetical protein